MQENNAERKLTEILYIKAAAILSINLTGLSWIFSQLSEPEKIGGPNFFVLTYLLLISISSIACMFVAMSYKEGAHWIELLNEHPTTLEKTGVSITDFIIFLEQPEFNNLSILKKRELIEGFKRKVLERYNKEIQIAKNCAKHIFGLSFSLAVIFIFCVIAKIYLSILN